MQVGGQSILDRLLAAKNTIAGQAVAKVVCKATTEEVAPPKRKHLDFLLQATHQNNVSIPDIADLLMERSQNSSWIVAFKSLITIHRLMSYGNERFESYMASHSYHLQVFGVLDRVGLPGTDMLIYIGRYADYLNEKREAYKMLGYDFCKIQRGKNDEPFRVMPVDKWLKLLPIIQKQIDAILHFEVTPNTLTNGIIYSCFFLLFKDLLHLYGIYTEGIVNIAEKCFNSNKKQCRETVDIYKKFLDRTDQVEQYLKIHESYEKLFDRYLWDPPSGVDRNEIAELLQTIKKNKTANNRLESLENHLAVLEGKKISSSSSSSSSSSTISKSLMEQDSKNFTHGFVDNFTDSPKQVFQDEAKALEKFSAPKELTSSTSLPTQTKVTSNEVLFSGTDFFSQQQSSNPQEQQIHETAFNKDFFLLAMPSSEPSTNTDPVFSNSSNTSASQLNSLFDVFESSVTSNKSTNIVPMPTNNSISNTSTVSKPSQPRDLNSSLNQLIDHLDIHDHTKIGKDHLWTTEDIKNRQIINSIPVTTYSSGTIWTPSTTTISSVNSLMTQAGTTWQQSSSSSVTNNSFATSSGSMPMNFNSRPTNVSTNPFVDQTSTNVSMTDQAQTFNPFDNL